jgi:hypothetical protein
MEEEWRPLPWAPKYMVSNLGKIKGIRGNIMVGGLDTDGYRQVIIYPHDGTGGKDKRFMRKVYRLVMETFNPDNNGKDQIDHINRNKLDDRLENLRWVTSQENNSNRGRPLDMIGINWNKKNETFMVRVHNGVGKKQEYLGCRYNLEDAKKLRDDYLNTQSGI